MNENKICITCGIVKSIDKFRENRNQCLLCINKLARERYNINRDKITIRNKKWASAHKDKMNDIKRKWAINNPEKIKESKKKWYVANREKSLDYIKNYHKEHPEKCREAVHKYNIANKEKIKEREKKYRLANPERVKENYRKYRKAHIFRVREEKRNRSMRERNAPGDGITDIQEKQLYEEYNYICAYCNKIKSVSELTIDHIIPLNKGGSHDISNVVPACKSCNCSKQDKSLLFYMYYRLNQ
jgi:5-methylcytosine-specific restriction endonuclease McrA